MERRKPYILSTIDRVFRSTKDGLVSKEEWCQLCMTVPELRAFFKFVTGLRSSEGLPAVPFKTSVDHQETATAASENV